jgi:uncharacterized RDD family membrane protein YckC
MYCPSCGARNLTGATACVDCGRHIPVAAPAPAPAPAQPPSILRRPGPLAPPSLDGLPRAPHSHEAPKTAPGGPPNHGPAVDIPTTAPLTTAPLTTAPLTTAPATVADRTLVEGVAVTAPSSTAPSPTAPSPIAPDRPAPAVVASVAPATAARQPVPPLAAPPGPPNVASPAPSRPPPAPPVAAAHAPERPVSSSSSSRAAGPAPPPAAQAQAQAPATTNARPTAPARPVTLKLAVPGALRQWGAAMVDGLGVAAAVFVALRALLAASGVRPSVQAVVDALHQDPVAVAPLLLAIPSGVFAWHALAARLQGTPGQRLVGLRLVDRMGRRPTLPRLLVRAGLQALATLLCLAGPAWALLVDGRRRGVGDIVAGTVAVVVPKDRGAR